jgi:hypothetical protein
MVEASVLDFEPEAQLVLSQSLDVEIHLAERTVIYHLNLATNRERQGVITKKASVPKVRVISR